MAYCRYCFNACRILALRNDIAPRKDYQRYDYADLLKGVSRIHGDIIVYLLLRSIREGAVMTPSVVTWLAYLLENKTPTKQTHS